MACAALVCAGAVAAPADVRVTGDRVILRALPNGESEIVGQVSAGERLVAPEGVQAGAAWVKVRPPDTVDLWIYAPLVKDSVVIADGTYVRPGPGLQFRAVGRLHKGTALTTRGPTTGDWLRIAPVEGACEVWISAAYVTVAEEGGEPTGDKPPAPPAAGAEEQAGAEAEGEQAEDKLPAPPAVGAEEQAGAEATEKQAEGMPPAPPAAGARGETPPALPPPRPYALTGQALDARRPQGMDVVICGRLERIPLAIAPSFARYQLQESTGSARKTTICRIIGLAGQWSELAGSEVEISGRLWNIAGDPCPVLEALRADRLASWE